MDVVGGGRSRTADLIHVMDALFYLSYPPSLKEKTRQRSILPGLIDVTRDG